MRILKQKHPIPKKRTDNAKSNMPSLKGIKFYNEPDC